MTAPTDPSAQELVAAYDGKGFLRWALADSAGDFRLEGLTPGRYALLSLGQCAKPRVGGGGSSDPAGDLLPPHEFFELDVVVREGETTRRNIDLGVDGLGSINGKVTEALAPAVGVTSYAISYGMLLGGIPRSFSTLGGDEALKDDRFEIANLLPGRYRVYARESPGRRRYTAEAEVDVAPGTTAHVVLAPPTASLVLPIEGVDDDVIREVRVIGLSRVISSGQWHRDREESWGGYRVSRLQSEVRIDRVPSGLVRVKISAPGFPEATSELIDAAPGGVTEARAALRLVPQRRSGPERSGNRE